MGLEHLYPDIVPLESRTSNYQQLESRTLCELWFVVGDGCNIVVSTDEISYQPLSLIRRVLSHAMKRFRIASLRSLSDA